MTTSTETMMDAGTNQTRPSNYETSLRTMRRNGWVHGEVTEIDQDIGSVLAVVNRANRKNLPEGLE